jgi:hypothetical protein
VVNVGLQQKNKKNYNRERELNMNKIINIVSIVAVVVVAIYFAPFLITVISSGVVQFLVSVGMIYLIVKTALKSNSNDYDKYQ